MTGAGDDVAVVDPRTTATTHGVARQRAAPVEGGPRRGEAAPDLWGSTDERDWLALAEAAVTDPLARLTVAARAEGRRLADLAVDRIAATIPSYATVGAVERDDLWWSVYRNLELILLTLAQRRNATAAELEARAELGRRRADAGMDCADITRAFRVGYQRVWEVLTRLARADGAAATEALLENASRVWASLDAVSSAVEHAHRARMLERAAGARRAGVELVDGIRDYPFARNETAARARACGLDPTGVLVVAVGSGSLTTSPSRSVVVALDDRTVVVAQTAAGDTGVTLAATLRQAGMGHVGVGMPAAGLAGAQASLRHAELAHRSAVALGRADAIFGRDWFECLVADASAVVSPVLARVTGALRSSPELAATARAVVEADGSLETAAKALFVHPNTVAYRLRRLAATTGIAPRSADGLLRLRAALTIVAMPDI